MVWVIRINIFDIPTQSVTAMTKAATIPFLFLLDEYPDNRFKSVTWKLVSSMILCLLTIPGIGQELMWNTLTTSPLLKGSRTDDIYFINDSTGWAANGNGEIFSTRNSGKSWSLQFKTTTYFRSIEFINDTTGFVGSLRGEAYKTTDAGVTWNRIDQHFPQTVKGICGISHFKNSIVMVGIWNSPAYVLTSVDEGITWSYQDMTSYASALVDCWYKSEDSVFVSGKGKAGEGIILFSGDKGMTWQKASPSDVPEGTTWKLQFVTSSVGYASLFEGAGTKSHILKTTDGGLTFKLIKILNRNISMEGIGFINSTTGWVGGWSRGMYETKDGGITWKYLDANNNVNRYFILNKELAYAAGEQIYIYKKTESPVTSILPSENELIHTIDAYPNPSSENVKLKVNLKQSTYVVLELYDQNGKSVKRLVDGFFAQGEFIHEIKPGDFSSGIYTAVVYTNENSLAQKIFIR